MLLVWVWAEVVLVVLFIWCSVWVGCGLLGLSSVGLVFGGVCFPLWVCIIWFRVGCLVVACAGVAGVVGVLGVAVGSVLTRCVIL